MVTLNKEACLIPEEQRDFIFVNSLQFGFFFRKSSLIQNLKHLLGKFKKFCCETLLFQYF